MMTTDARNAIRAENDRRARERQQWWDEFDAFCKNPTHCTCQMISRDVRDCALHGHLFDLKKETP